MDYLPIENLSFHSVNSLVSRVDLRMKNIINASKARIIASVA